MAWLDIKWQLNAWRFNERDDEQGLQFAIVLIDAERGWSGVERYETGNLSNLGNQVFGGRIQIPSFHISGRGYFGIPDSLKPYLGIVVRAIEYDNSSIGNREADFNNFITVIEEGVKNMVDNGRIPSGSDLFNFANSSSLRDRRWKDDDDLIGNISFAYADFGMPVNQEYHRDTRIAYADPHFLGYIESRRFAGEGAIWSISTWPTILTGNASDSPDEYNTQERGGWWLFTPADMR
tara:strand:- start:1544 stop:2251 length:708 start_codon:yes stop_codon:yes gene_type:complete